MRTDGFQPSIVCFFDFLINHLRLVASGVGKPAWWAPVRPAARGHGDLQCVRTLVSNEATGYGSPLHTLDSTHRRNWRLRLAGARFA